MNWLPQHLSAYADEVENKCAFRKNFDPRKVEKLTESFLSAKIEPLQIEAQ